MRARAISETIAPLSATIVIQEKNGVKRQHSHVLYQIRSVPGLSTIEMSPGFDFTMPRKTLGFSSAASLVAKGDAPRGSGNEIA
jgi:hypothetical protein